MSTLIIIIEHSGSMYSSIKLTFGVQLLASRSKAVTLEAELDSARVQHADSLAQVRHSSNLACTARRIAGSRQYAASLTLCNVDLSFIRR